MFKKINLYIKKFIYFFLRDFLIWKSYKLQALLGILSGFLGLIQFGLIGKFISGGNYFPMIEKYGGDIITYFITGSVFLSFTSLALTSFKNIIRQEQLMGTIEYLLLSKTSLWEVFMTTLLSRFIFNILNTTLIFLFLIYIFQVKIFINIFLSFLILSLTMIVLSGIGIMSAGFIMIFKKGDPINWIYSFLAGIFSGIYFPIEILPNWLQVVSKFLPTTYAMDSLRKSLIINATFEDIKINVLILIIMSIFLLPTGIIFFKHAFNKARYEGTLIQY
ncbi:ABC transporter permease [Oceanotoga teriensis]|uniref:ABC transporter permease n=1 Tax=Oceanotoga teriensis TaxID=515440 RepID=UPI002712BDEC|nr:ABC transporter permease [Oceanotoga teriensis]MDO7976480.1 ABC transporter permease [Oceanotoga teriensis]